MAQDDKTKRRPKRKARHFSQQRSSDRYFSQGKMPKRDGRGLRRK